MLATFRQPYPNYLLWSINNIGDLCKWPYQRWRQVISTHSKKFVDRLGEISSHLSILPNLLLLLNFLKPIYLSPLYLLEQFCQQPWQNFVRSVIFTKLVKFLQLFYMSSSFIHTILSTCLVRLHQICHIQQMCFISHFLRYNGIHSHLFYHSLKAVGWHPKTHFNRSKFSTTVCFNSFKTLI